MTSLKVRFRPVGRLAACRRPYFSLLCQRKGEQKKGEPKAVPLRGPLRYARRPGSGANCLRSPCTRRFARGWRSRPKPQSIYYDYHVPQSGPTNPYGNAPIHNS